MYNFKLLRLLALAFFLCTPTFACTVFTASDGRTTLVGNNEDSSPSLKTFLWFYPGKKQKNGFVTWGVKEKLPEGGMNDKGLFWDAAALMQEIPIKRDAAKPDFEGYFVNKALAECATVDEVIRLVKRFNLVWQERAQVLVADASGDYALIHANYIIRKSDQRRNYQAVTNFSLQYGTANQEPCQRYNTAEMLLGKNLVSVPLFKEILSKTAQRAIDNATIYSQIADLKNGRFYLYQHHNFEEELVISLAYELKKGKHQTEIKKLFKADRKISGTRS